LANQKQKVRLLKTASHRYTRATWKTYKTKHFKNYVSRHKRIYYQGFVGIYIEGFVGIFGFSRRLQHRAQALTASDQKPGTAQACLSVPYTL
jgi:hypothetical protein